MHRLVRIDTKSNVVHTLAWFTGKGLIQLPKCAVHPDQSNASCCTNLSMFGAGADAPTPEVASSNTAHVHRQFGYKPLAKSLSEFVVTKSFSMIDGTRAECRSQPPGVQRS